MVEAAIGAAVAIVVALAAPAFSSAAERRLRKRETFARAVGALVEYREFPYVIRRRGSADPEAERLRISAAVSSVQRELAEAQVWIRAEASAVADAFDTAVDDHRRIAGRLMHEAWETKPIVKDDGMNIAEIHEELRPLRAYDQQLAEAITKAVRFTWNPFR